MNKYILSFFAGCTLFACTEAPKKNLSEFKCLIGTWEGSRDGMALKEIWKEKQDSAFSGEGIASTGKDTLFHEKLALRIQDTNICYIATLPNNKEPVSFKLTSSEKNKWKFENKEHDFPQLIVYTLIRPDSLVASIEGIDKGKPSREEFYFKKTN